ncbi:MAG: hypothetical protein R3A50_16985 [Saprospiraceae bacterium]|nr:hypothetical protein [Saprospiraceae bacterium]MCB9342910.1 hypothetical protein [Lewinellaceae bacterium]
MTNQRPSKIRRLWQKSPKYAIAFVRRKVSRQAKRIIPIEEWNKNWLGEEMRPYNSLHN